MRKEIMQNLLDIIFPPQCEICGKIGTYICDQCYTKLKSYEIHNKKNDKLYIYTYENKIRKLLIDYKFNNKAYLYNFFEKCIIKNKKACNFLNTYDIIIPVPLHKKRMSERGYNQSELIARKLAFDFSCHNSKSIELCKQKEIKFEPSVLKKSKNTKKQSLQTLVEREKSVKGVYFVENEDKIKAKKVLLFDDIYTTGSTCRECKKVLLNAGASKVGIMTIARDFLK